MKVKELIKELQKADPEALVILTVGQSEENGGDDLYSSSEFNVLGAEENLGYIDLFMEETANQQL